MRTDVSAQDGQRRIRLTYRGQREIALSVVPRPPKPPQATTKEQP